MPNSVAAPGVGALKSLHAAAGQGDTQAFLQHALGAVREHLGLQVAYVSEFEGNDSVFRVVDAPGLEHLAAPGDRRSLDDVYCRHILEGRLPELIPDTASEPLCVSLPITSAVPIGAHVSIPLRMPDGSLYGMFCCLGPAADPSLNARDLATMRTFAELAAFEIARDREQARDRAERVARIERVLEAGVSVVYQPIWSLATNRPVGFEALSRFQAEPVRGPDKWFAEAASVGMATELELMAVSAALEGIHLLAGNAYVAVNVSPATVLDPALSATLRRFPLKRIVLEVTEHDLVGDYEALTAVIAPLRADGMKLAVDDAGAGYSGLQQILRMHPDLIKLDRALIQDIQHDPGKRALAAALGVFARDTGSRIIAEGVETDGELAMLRALGIDRIQGYLLGRPMAIEQAVALTADASATRERA